MSANTTKICPTCNTRFDTAAKFCPHDSTVLVQDPEAIVGTTLDSLYRIEKLLGKGGMGAVYRARHIVLGDEVAIKVLRAGMESNEQWLRRFQREGKAARRFKHPNAVVVHDLRVSNDGTTYMVLEYIDGPDLRTELKHRGHFEPDALLPILRQLADVLDAGHAAGVVHRDLKPDNVMLSSGPGGQTVVKLLDLGIAKLRDSADQTVPAESALTVAGQIIGTPHYMSPEQWGELPRDGSREIDGRADVYSFAVMTYELLAGHWPVSGTSIQELRSAHVSGVFKPFGEIRSDLPPAIERVLARGMARDRGDRYSTAGELLIDFERALEGSWDESGAATSQPTTHAATMAMPSDARTSAQMEHPETVAEPGSGGAVPSVSDEATAIPDGTTAEATPEVAPKPDVAPRPEPAPPPVPVAPRPSPVRLWAVVAIVAVVAIGGLAVAFWPRSEPVVDPKPKPTTPTTPQPAAPVARMGYYLEEIRGKTAKRVTGEQPLTSGDDLGLRLHFVPPEVGYLYIIGLGPGNVPMTFLTSVASADTGVTTNRVEKGIEFVFPGGGESMGLTPETMTTPFTVVFSRKPLQEPAFFALEPQRVLTPSEQEALESFTKRHRTQTNTTSTAEPPLVTVFGPEGDDPLVFELTVRHLPK